MQKFQSSDSVDTGLTKQDDQAGNQSNQGKSIHHKTIGDFKHWKLWPNVKRVETAYALCQPNQRWLNKFLEDWAQKDLHFERRSSIYQESGKATAAAAVYETRFVQATKREMVFEALASS